MKSLAIGLACRECGEKYPHSPRHVCDRCFGPLEIQYDYDAIKLLARTEGVFTQPAGGTEVAVAQKLIDQARIPSDESIVISITGTGYKSLEAVAPCVE